MLTSPLLQRVIDVLQHWEQEPIGECDTRPVSGGDINTSYLVTTKARRYFVKTLKHPQAQAMHKAEADGLRALAQVGALAVPDIIGTGLCAAESFLVLSELELAAPADWQGLAKGLAQLHQLSSERYGWPHDNFIGSSKQSNTYHANWSDFWWQQRLLPQLESAYANGYRQELEAHQGPLQRASEALLQAHRPTPVLVHGDLWSGNVGFVDNSQPAIFDPACYYGDREVDLAMSRLFGGFAASFYRAYSDELPLPPGDQQRETLYNLYHLLNHLNLFGGGYLPQCLRSIKQLASYT